MNKSRVFIKHCICSMFRGAWTRSHDIGRPDKQGAFSSVIAYCLCEKEKKRQLYSPHAPPCFSQVVALSAVPAIHCAWASQLLGNPAVSSVLKWSQTVVLRRASFARIYRRAPRPFLIIGSGQRSISEDLNLGDQVPLNFFCPKLSKLGNTVNFSGAR